VKICEGLGIKGDSWFDESIQMKISNGIKTFFWLDGWVGAAPLRERFRRLFDLSVHKVKTVFLNLGKTKSNSNSNQSKVFELQNCFDLA